MPEHSSRKKLSYKKLSQNSDFSLSFSFPFLSFHFFSFKKNIIITLQGDTSLRRRSSAASAAAERRAVGAGSDLLVAAAAAAAAERRAVTALSSAVPAAVATAVAAAVAAEPAVAARRAVPAVTTVTALGARVPLQGPRRLLERGGNDLRGQVQDAAQVLDPFVGQKPVVVPPGEALGDVLFRFQGLHELDDLEVGDTGDLRVLGEVEVLLSEEDALFFFFFWGGGGGM